MLWRGWFSSFSVNPVRYVVTMIYADVYDKVKLRLVTLNVTGRLSWILGYMFSISCNCYCISGVVKFSRDNFD